MHELSIAHSIVEAACQAVEPGQQVFALNLQLGDMSGVVEEALRFCFDLAAADTPLQGCRLNIEKIPITLYCHPCQALFQPPTSYRLVCPTCQQPSADLRSGRELLFLSLEVED